ncbi:hypothetical protein ACF3MZ_26960 [Paenibacillaceae bacterium WGS1546]
MKITAIVGNPRSRSQIDRLPETVGGWYETSAKALRNAVLGKGA